MSNGTAKECLEAVFRFEQPDTTPLSSWLCNDAIVAHFAGEPLTVENASSVFVKGLRGCIDFTYQKDDKANLVLPEPEREETDEFGYRRHYVRWTSWVVGYPYPAGDTRAIARTVREEIERFRSWNERDAAEIISRADGWQSKLGDDTLLSGRTFVITGPGINYRDGLENFSYLLADYPELAIEWSQARHERWLRMIDLVEDATRYPIALVAGDLAYRGGTLVSPRWLKESGWYRRLAEIVDAFHQKGIKVMYHSDGDLRRILPDLVATGIDGLNPVEVAAGMDLRALREQYPHLVLAGGIPYDVLLNGSREEIKQVTLNCLQTASPGYIAGSSTDEFSDDLPLENFLEMFETVSNWRP
jgi:hypothetical protein